MMQSIPDHSDAPGTDQQDGRVYDFVAGYPSYSLAKEAQAELQEAGLDCDVYPDHDLSRERIPPYPGVNRYAAWVPEQDVAWARQLLGCADPQSECVSCLLQCPRCGNRISERIDRYEKPTGCLWFLTTLFVVPRAWDVFACIVIGPKWICHECRHIWRMKLRRRRDYVPPDVRIGTVPEFPPEQAVAEAGPQAAG